MATTDVRWWRWYGRTARQLGADGVAGRLAARRALNKVNDAIPPGVRLPPFRELRKIARAAALAALPGASGALSLARARARAAGL